MAILIVGLVAALSLLILPRFIGTKLDKTLVQYGILEKRFGLSQKVTRSVWGKGIGERHTLAGHYRGYDVSLYHHFHGKGKRRQEWTSLVFETLFAGGFELRIGFKDTSPQARFASLENGASRELPAGVSLACNDDAFLEALARETVADRLASLSSAGIPGAILLSKGFLEYREAGQMVDEAMRLRFQQAFLVLAELADALSVHLAKRQKG
ncbi:hypothetical protein [Pelagicoccus sp. SDUM812003]|uniref:hypothetical protein n=1 Tax=Pelagicoccus sp. SDUM812003 TaxID=3041267 RepID=UPI00280D9431|nr:hypothetical protein [Pelagicoccus sp. SDUM812003]MDQ8202568.1 hypothetical protein [Pelagicoccus sp. SDUM812003]